MTLIKEEGLMSVVTSHGNTSAEAFQYSMGNDSLVLGVLSENSSEAIQSSSSGGCMVFLFFFFTIFTGFLCILGLIGNVVSMIVLQKDRGGHVHAATFLLQALAIADNLVLGISFIFLCIVFGLLPIIDEWSMRRMMIPYVVTYIEPVAHMAHTATVWMTVLLAVNRYVAICRPFDTHRLVSIGKTKIQVAFVFAFAVALNFPRFFQHRIVYRENSTMPINEATFMGIRSTFGMVYTTWLYTVIVFILPLILLVILNGRLIVELRRMSMRRGSIQDERRSEENITRVMIVIIIVFIFCICPERVNTIFKHFIKSHACTPWFYFDCVSQVLVVTNSSTNFLVYYIFRRRFRQVLFQKLCYSSRRLSRVEEYTQNGHTDNRQAMTLLSIADPGVTSLQPTMTEVSHTVM